MRFTPKNTMMIAETLCVLVVDDGSNLCQKFIAKDYTYKTCCEKDSFKILVDQKIDCILFENHPSKQNGSEIIQKWRKLAPHSAVVIFTKKENESSTTELLKSGAHDYIINDFLSKERLQLTIKNAINYAKQKQMLEHNCNKVSIFNELAHHTSGMLSSIKDVLKYIDTSSECIKSPQQMRYHLELIRKFTTDAEEIVREMSSLSQIEKENCDCVKEEGFSQENPEVKENHTQEDFVFYKILVVDDQEINRYILVEILEKLGHIVEEACDANEALEKLDNSIQIVITDFSMPNITGDTLALEIKKMYPHIYIILLTGYDEDPSIKSEFFDGVLKKPIDPVKLVDCISSVLTVSNV